MTDQLTLVGTGRPIGMSRGLRKIAIVASIACGLASVKVMANPGIRRPVAQFIHFYQQSEDMNLWERVVYSLLLAKTTEPSS